MTTFTKHPKYLFLHYLVSFCAKCTPMRICDGLGWWFASFNYFSYSFIRTLFCYQSAFNLKGIILFLQLNVNGDQNSCQQCWIASSWHNKTGCWAPFSPTFPPAVIGSSHWNIQPKLVLTLLTFFSLCLIWFLYSNLPPQNINILV